MPAGSRENSKQETRKISSFAQEPGQRLPLARLPRGSVPEVNGLPTPAFWVRVRAGQGNHPGRYVRDRKILSLPLAIHKMTALPAGIFQLEDRGRIRTGAWADITLFDPKKMGGPASHLRAWASAYPCPSARPPLPPPGWRTGRLRTGNPKPG